MSDDLITIEVDGQNIEARKGSMLIEATDAAGIYIPRFCYHKHLSVAANCRMCLVDVERAPKPLPACATPVMDGMKVSTRSERAVDAQKATMEFLLINHPLDCPICDQGGECELQDLAMGYGGDISQYTEAKRVVPDKDIGPLVQTDMTRCIHCTRCVRFGEEIAGLRELGATGRGEHVEIGTYIEKAMNSELSGNVIDLCPVGALTSKPYRYSARAWELRQHDGISIHDCVGSNLHFHVKGSVVKRVVPKDNDDVNETWLSDRDRFSYEGLHHDSRLLLPRIKEDGAWRDCDWDTAIEATTAALGASQANVAGLSSPSSTTEEQYLLQKLVRELGGSSIDHRLRQQDFSLDGNGPLFPSLRTTLDKLEDVDAIVLVGSNPRHEQPLLNHRLRKAALKGAKVISINCVDYDSNYSVAETVLAKPGQLAHELAGIVKASKCELREDVANAIKDCDVSEQHQRIAAILSAAENAIILTGNSSQRDERYGSIISLAESLAECCGGKYGQLTDGANAAGAWLAGAVPHRGPGGRKAMAAGANVAELANGNENASENVFILLGVEPALDCIHGDALRRRLATADSVISLHAYQDDVIDEVATIQLPIAVFAENEGSFVNCAGQWQSFVPAIKAPGSARPAWKVLRVLGEKLSLAGFDSITCADVTSEVSALCADNSPQASGNGRISMAALSDREGQLACFVEIPMYQVDAMSRHASGLQQTAGDAAQQISLSPLTAAKLSFEQGETVTVGTNGDTFDAQVLIDKKIPDDTVVSYMANASVASSAIQLGKA